jgi:HSP20 family protein
MSDLVQRGRTGAPTRWENASPFLALHRDMNRLFDETFRGFGAVAPFAGASGFSWPSVEISETESEVTVTAELAGLDEKDVEVQVEDNVLTLRGEKRTEINDKERRYTERSYGRFERRLALGEVDEERATATFKNGVLTVTLPKLREARDSARRIPIGKG